MTVQRRNAVRARIAELQADALYITKIINVRYLTGFSGSNAQLIIGPESDVFLTDSRYEEQASHEVPDAKRIVYTSGQMMPAIGGALNDWDVRRLAVEEQHMTLFEAKVLRARVDGVTLVETSGVVERERIVKTPDEIESVRRACAIGDTGLDSLLGRLKEGLTEREVAAELEDTMRRAGSDGLSFDTIIAFGESAAEPHHAPTERALKNGDLIKLDFGATYNGYHSDMTRTIAFGKPGDEQRRIYEIVRRAQQAGIDRVRSGVTGGDVDAASRDIVQEEGFSFGHGVGHGVGLEVHEAPSVRRGSDEVLAPGMVVTVEPGIYIPGFAGVRIEDTLAVTQDGCDILTRSPKELIEV